MAEPCVPCALSSPLPLKSLGDDVWTFPLSKLSKNSESNHSDCWLDNLNKLFPDATEYVHIVAYKFDGEREDEVELLPEGNIENMSDYPTEVLKMFAQSHEQKEKLKLFLQERGTGDEAVFQVISAFEKWGKRKNLRMFILSNFAYHSYVSKSKSITMAMMPGNLDVMIICEQVGVIFIHVKCCTEETDLLSVNKELRKGFNQLYRHKTAFFEANCDLGFITPEFPTLEFVAMPFLNSNSIGRVQVCSEHENNVLRSEDLEISNFNDIKIASRPKFWSGGQFRNLSARYIASSGYPETLKKSITATSAKLERLMVSPFPSQEAILNQGNKFQAIKGDFGTGKTLLLCRKALQSLNEYPGSKAVFLICADVDRYSMLHTKIKSSPLRRYVKHCFMAMQPKFNQSKIEILSLSDLYTKSAGMVFPKRVLITRQLLKSLVEMRMERNVNVFIDELPWTIFKECESELYCLTKDKNANLMWIAVAPQSFYKYLNPPTELTGYGKIFKINTLKFNMRNSVPIVELMKFITEYTNESVDVKGKSETNTSKTMKRSNVQGARPLLFWIPKCCCPKKNPTEVGIFCFCLEERVKVSLQYIHDQLDIPVKNSKQIIYVVQHIYNDSFESQILKKLVTLFRNVFHTLGLPSSQFQWITFANKSDSQSREEYFDDAIQVVDWGTFIGCESEIVVNIDFFSMSQWLPRNEVGNGSTMVLSRCISQYIHVALQGDEPETFIDQHIEMFQCYVDEHRVKTCKDVNHEKNLKALESFITVMETFKTHRGKLLNDILEKGLMTESFVPFSV